MEKTLDVVFEARNLPAGLPNMWALCAPAGTGKSTALAFAQVAGRRAATEPPPIRITIHHDGEGKTAVIRRLADAAGLPQEHTRTCSRAFDALLEELQAAPRMILIDEGQFLRGHPLELVRVLHDLAGIAVIFVGDEMTERALRANPRVHTRTAFEYLPPVTLEDARLLAEVHVPGVSVADELLEQLLDDTRVECGRQRLPNARALCRALHAVRELAFYDDLEHVDLRTWRAGRGVAPALPQDARRVA